MGSTCLGGTVKTILDSTIAAAQCLGVARLGHPLRPHAGLLRMAVWLSGYDASNRIICFRTLTREWSICEGWRRLPIGRTLITAITAWGAFLASVSLQSLKT
jgi:hypothetical protein